MASSIKTSLSDVPPSATSAKHFELSVLAEEEETKCARSYNRSKRNSIDTKMVNFDGTILPACTIVKRDSVDVGIQTGVISPLLQKKTDADAQFPQTLEKTHTINNSPLLQTKLHAEVQSPQSPQTQPNNSPLSQKRLQSEVQPPQSPGSTKPGMNSPQPLRNPLLYNVSKELLYQHVPLPPSTTPTPSASYCSLDSY